MRTLKKTSWLLFNRGWQIAIIAIIVCVFFFPVFKGKIPLPGDFVLGVYPPWIDHIWTGLNSGVPVKNPILADVVSFTFPMQTLAIKMMMLGQAPLWNPYILGGTPLLANFQSAPFAITNIVYMFSDILTGWTLRIMLQHFLAALFTYFLLRHWKVSKLGSITGGIIFSFSGFNLIWSQWNAHALTAAFIPLLMLFEERFLIYGKARDGAFFSLALALQIFSGYPQVVIYSLMSLGILWIFNIKREKVYLIKTFELSLFGVLGLLISAVQLLPARELLQFSQRSTEPHPFEWAFLPWKKLITFIAPDYFGNHATGNWWGPQDYTSNTGFVGVITMSFSLIGFFERNKKFLFLICLLIISLALSLPTPISIGLWSSGVLGLQAASAHRALVLTNLSLALFAGFGVDHVLQKNNINLLKFVPIVLILCVFALLSFIPPFSEHKDVALRNLFYPFSFLTFVLLFFLFKLQKKNNLFTIFLIAIGIFELFRFGWKYTPFIDRKLVFPTTPVLTYLEDLPKPIRTTGAHIIPMNLRMNYGISALEGYDAIYPESISTFLSVLNNGKVGERKPGRYGFVDDDTSPLLNLAAVSYIISEKENGLQPKRFLTDKYESIPVDEPNILVYKNKQALPESFVAYDWEVADSQKSLSLLSSNYPFSEKVILDKEPSISREKKGEYTLSYEKYSETDIVMKVNSNNNGILFSSETFFPGWEAYVDGIPEEIIKADYTFRAIPFKKGTHIVEYVYKPNSFYSGLKISILSLVLSVLIIVMPLFKRRYSQYN